MTKHLKRILITIIFAELLHSPALALNNEEVFSQFQFNFITPGARATAFGGAFIGLADDATAAVSNPAGLTILTEPEISAEFKYLGYTTEHAYGDLEEPYYDVEADIPMKEFDDAVRSAPFVGLVFPYQRFVLSLYRQEAVNYATSFRVTGRTSIRSVDAAWDLRVTNYGMGFAIKLFEELSLAFSGGWSEMNMRAHNWYYEPIYDPAEFDPLDYTEDTIDSETAIDDNDNGFNVNVGLLWRPHPKFSIGVVYKSGVEFKVKEVGFTWGGFLDPSNISRYDPDLADFTVNVPDSFGVGMAFRATDFFTIMLDVVHIEYKNLLKDFDIAAYGDYPLSETTEDDFTVSNATEIHLGGEYILPFGKRLLALRAGVYYDPDHTIRYTTSLPRPDNDFRLLFPGGDDQIHVTGGLGLVLNEQFQIDTAVNIADRNTQFSVSAVYRLGGRKPQATKPLLTHIPFSKPVEEIPPSVRFIVVMVDGIEGKTLDIRKVTTDTHGIGDVKVTTKQIGATEFIITAMLERDQKSFMADIRIDIEQNEMTIKNIDSFGQVMIMQEQPDALEFMIRFK